MPTLTIDSNSLQTANIVTRDIDHFGLDKDFEAYPIAGANRSYIPNYNYIGRSITLKGSLNASSIAAMDALIDTFNGYFVGKDKNLDLEYSGSTRRYVVTSKPPSIERPGGLMYAEFTVVLKCSVPFGVDTTETTLSTTTGITTATTDIAITVGGNAETQYPTITATLNSGTGLTAATISFGNNNNGQVLSITRTWAAADVIFIDPYNEIVTVNGTAVYFTGAMPIFETGVQAVNYSDTLATRSIDVVVKQYRYWL